MKEIPLTRGLVALVDDKDYDNLMAVGPWHARKGRHTYYAYAHITMNRKQRVRLSMHAVLLGTRGKRIVGDHRDGDGLNNQRHNLRRATTSQNNRNKRKQSNGKTSRFIGVSTHKRRPGMFRATIHGNGKHIELGFFSAEEEAARAHDRAALKYFGEFARLNFQEVCHRATSLGS